MRSRHDGGPAVAALEAEGVVRQHEGQRGYCANDSDGGTRRADPFDFERGDVCESNALAFLPRQRSGFDRLEFESLDGAIFQRRSDFASGLQPQGLSLRLATSEKQSRR